MSELETMLRATLRERAEDIRVVPATALPVADPVDPVPVTPLAGPASGPARNSGSHRPTTARRRAPRTGWLIAAVVVAVLAVAGVLAAVGSRDTASRPVGPAGRGSSAPHVVTTELAQCTAPLPVAWLRAIRPLSAANYQPDGVDPQGETLTAEPGAYATSGTGGYGRLMLSAFASDVSPRVLVNEQPGSNRNVYGATFAGPFIVVAIGHTGQNTGAVMELRVLEAATGRLLHTIPVMSEQDYLDAGPTSDSWAVQDGTIYWSLRPTYGSGTGTVVAYDIATGTTSTVYRGQSVRLNQAAGGIEIQAGNSAGSFQILIPATNVPAEVLAATSATDRTTLGTDGTHWAWFDTEHGRIGWYDGSRIRYVTGSDLPSRQDAPGAVDVAGPYVFFLDNNPTRTRQVVLDIRTGAVASMADSASGLPSVMYTAGAFVNGYGSENPKAGGGQMLFNVSTLPSLAC